MRRLWTIVLCALCACVLLESGAETGQTVAMGTWGGKDAGLIVTDTGAHLHIGCTVGNVQGLIPLNGHGGFDVAESHNITAHPVDAGIYLPARITGRVDVLLRALTLTVTVEDTVHGTIVVLGPVRLRLGVTPEMGPCPICATPGDRMRATR